MTAANMSQQDSNPESPLAAAHQEPSLSATPQNPADTEPELANDTNVADDSNQEAPAAETPQESSRDGNAADQQESPGNQLASPSATAAANGNSTPLPPANNSQSLIASLLSKQKTKKSKTLLGSTESNGFFYAKPELTDQEKSQMRMELEMNDPKFQQLQKLVSEGKKDAKHSSTTAQPSVDSSAAAAQKKKKASQIASDEDVSSDQDLEDLHSSLDIYDSDAPNDDQLSGMDYSYEKPSNRYAFRSNRFSVKEICNRLHYLPNKRPEKHEDRIKQVIYVRESEDCYSDGTNQLLIVFNNNNIRYRNKEYKFLNDSALDHESRYMRVFLDPTGHHLIVCKKAKSRLQDSTYHMTCLYANLAHIEKNQDPKWTKFSLAYPKGNQYEKITSVGWNIYDSTSIDTGSILIGTNKKRIYVGSISGHLQKNRFKLNNVKKFALLRDFITDQEEMQTLRKPIQGIEIHRQSIESEEVEHKKERCFVLLSSLDRFYEFSGDWYQTDPYKFIQGASLESSSIYHPVGAYPAKGGLSLVSEVRKMSSSSKKDSAADATTTAPQPDWTKWKKKAFITPTQSGIFHGRLDISFLKGANDQNNHSCIADSEYLVYSDDIRDRYCMIDGDLSQQRNQPVPEPPRDAAATSNHIVLIVPFQRSLSELVFLDIPPDVNQIPQENGRPAVTPIIDERVILESVHQGIHSFASFSYHSSATNPKLYAYGPDCIVEIDVKKAEKKDAWTHYLDRADAYHVMEKRILEESIDLSQSHIDHAIRKQLWSLLCKDYYLLAYKKAKDADGANALRALIMTSLSNYCIAVGDILQAAIWFTCSNQTVSQVVDQLASLGHPKATRFYLMLRYGYIHRKHPLWKEVMDTIGDESHKLEIQLITDHQQQLMAHDFKIEAALDFPCITHQEAVCLIVEMYMQELNQIDEEYQKACFENDNYMKRMLKRNITALKYEMKHKFLRNVQKHHLEKDRIYRLMISYGHTKSAMKFSNEYQDYDKVLSFHASESYMSNELSDQVISILDSLPINESTASKKEAEQLFVRYAACVFKYKPDKFVQVLSTKGFVNSMKLLPAMSNFGEFVRWDSPALGSTFLDSDDGIPPQNSGADDPMSGMMSITETDVSMTEKTDDTMTDMHDVDDDEENDEFLKGDITEASIEHAIQFFENALNHSSDVSKGSQSREEEYIYNTLIMLYSRQHSPQKFIDLFANSEHNLNDFNLEFGLRRTQSSCPKHCIPSYTSGAPTSNSMALRNGMLPTIRDGTKFSTFLWDVSNVAKRDWILANEQHHLKPEEVSQLSINIRLCQAAALAHYKLNLSENALRCAIQAVGHFNIFSLRRRHHLLVEEQVARDNLLRLIASIANSPREMHNGKESPDSIDYSKKLWIFVVQQMADINNMLPDLEREEFERKDTQEFVRNTVAADLSKLLKDGSQLHLQDVLSYIAPETPIHTFLSNILEYIHSTQESHSSTEHSLGESTDAGLKKGVRLSKKEEISFSNPHDIAARYEPPVRQIYSLYDAESCDSQSDNNLLYFKCRHVFSESSLEQAVMNVHQFMVNNNGEIEINPQLTEGGMQACELSEGQIIPVNVNLTRVRLEQMNHRLNIYNQHAELDKDTEPQSSLSLSKLLRFSSSEEGQEEWWRRRPTILRRILRRIAVKTKRQQLLTKQCPLCGSMSIPSIHFGFTQPEEKENNEWFINPSECLLSSSFGGE